MSIFGTGKAGLYPTSGAINISSVSYSGGLTQIDTASAHGLSAGDGVLIQGVSGTTVLNRSWKVYSIVDTDSFKIVNDSIETPTGGNITKGIYFAKSLITSYDFCIPNELDYRSIINGNKSYTNLGDYGQFKLIDLLWLYSSASTRMSSIYVYYHTNVIFAPHTKSIKDSGSSLVYCRLKGFRPFYWKNFINYDALELTLETIKYHDVTKLIV